MFLYAAAEEVGAVEKGVCEDGAEAAGEVRTVCAVIVLQMVFHAHL